MHGEILALIDLRGNMNIKEMSFGECFVIFRGSIWKFVIICASLGIVLTVYLDRTSFLYILCRRIYNVIRNIYYIPMEILDAIVVMSSVVMLACCLTVMMSLFFFICIRMFSK